MTNAEAMIFDGSSESIREICKWANSGGPADDEAVVQYEFSDDRLLPSNVMVYEDSMGDWANMEKGDLLVKVSNGDFYVAKMREVK